MTNKANMVPCWKKIRRSCMRLLKQLRVSTMYAWLMLVLLVFGLWYMRVRNDTSVSPARSLRCHDNKLMCRGGGFPAFWFGLGQACILKERVSRIRGWSSGAIVATLVACMETINVDIVIDAALRALREVPVHLGSLHNVVRVFLNILLQSTALANAHVRKLGIVVCDPRRWFRARLISSWTSVENLIDCVIASSLVPIFVRYRVVDDVYGCIDGGFSRDLTQISNGHILTGSPASSGNGISNIFNPVSMDEAKRLFLAGRHDAIAFAESCDS